MANDSVLNPGETLGDVVQHPAGLNDGETLGEPVTEPSAISRFGSGVAAGAKAMIPTDLPSVGRIVAEGAVGPLAQVIKMPGAAYDAYKQARSENQPVISSVASAAGGLVGLDPEGIRQRAAQGDIAGVIGEAVPSIAATLIGGEHERIGQAFTSDARALQTASAAHESAKAMYDQRMAEQKIATRQAIDATDRASKITDEFNKGNPNITQQHVDEANNAASAATANTRKAVQALTDAATARSEAGANVDRLTSKIQRSAAKVNQKQVQAAADAKEDFQKAIPPAPKGKAAYTDRDYDIGRRYLEQHHQNVEQVGSVQDAYDAFDRVQKDMENQVAPYREKYAKEPIQTNVRMDVRQQLAENPNRSFVDRGMKALEDYDLIDPTIEEADKIRKQLNSEVRARLTDTGWGIQDALDVDPAFAAKYYALDSLRDGIYNTFEDKNVQGIRELRQDEASIIRLRNAAQRQIAKGEVRLRGSNDVGPIRKTIGKYAAGATAAAGAGIGAAIPIPGATEAGAMAGDLLGKKIGGLISPSDLTRNELVKRSMKFTGGGVPITEITGVPQTPGRFTPPQPVSPVMDLYTPQRENTPLHSELATHYGENLDSSYLDLEKRFKNDIAIKKAHGVPLEASEKTLLGKMNLADAVDRLKAQQQIQERAAAGKTVPTATLPEDAEGLLHPPQSQLAHGMDTQSGILHTLANIVVGNEHDIDFADGVRSHLHPETASAGQQMAAPIDWSKFVNEDGEPDPAKIKSRMADIAATYMAGGVANDLYHDIPFSENYHLGADMRVLKSFFKNVGFTEAETMRMIDQATDDAKQILAKPGMREILESHAAVREPGLDERYHISPERVQQILDDTHGVINEGATRQSSRTNAAGDTENQGTGAEAENESENGNTEELRPTRQGSSGAEVGPAKANGGSERAETTKATESEPTGAKTPEPDLTNKPGSVDLAEKQTPLKQSHLVQVVDRDGGSHLEEVPAFSAKRAIAIIKKKFPDSAVYETEGAKPIPRPDKYEIPTGERLGMRHSTHPESKTEIHELGHAMVGSNEGLINQGMIRHTHPEIAADTRAAMRFSSENIVNPETGNIRGDKVGNIVRTAMAGIAADEAFNDIPRGANHNFLISKGGDGTIAYEILRNTGMDHEEIMSRLHQAIDDAKQYLTKPEVSGIIQENVGKREPELSSQYHYSPDRLNQMHIEAQRRINAGVNNTPNAGETSTAGQQNVPGRVGGVPEATGEATPAQKVAGLRERSTGSAADDQAIRDAGAIPAGVLLPGEPYSIRSFHDPETGSTLGFRAGEKITADAVRAKLAESRRAFGVRAGAEALSR